MNAPVDLSVHKQAAETGQAHVPEEGGIAPDSQESFR
jgi:hypothetical protein